MSTPIWTEQWADPPLTPATVPAARPAVPAGTAETWNLDPASGWADLPGADDAAIPPSLFRVFDLAAPAEHVLVRRTTGGPGGQGQPGPDWQVTRGDNAVTMDHAAGFEVHNVVAARGLASLAKGVPSGNGLVLPAAGNKTIERWTDAEIHRVARLNVPAGEAVPGSVYEAWAWGYYTCGSISGSHYLWGGLAWQATTIGFNGWKVSDFTPQLPTVPEAQYARWRIHGLLNIMDLGAGPVGFASTAMTLPADVEVDKPTYTMIIGPLTETGTPLATGIDQEFALGVALCTAEAPGGAPTGGYAVCQGGVAWRKA